MGRADDQVKVRGFRIEPGEVESALRAEPAVHDAAVAVHDQRLIGYVSGGADPRGLRTALAARLPGQLVPDAVVGLTELPRTPNGKLDRNALPAPETANEGRIAPRTARERVVAELLAELLGDAEVADAEVADAEVADAGAAGSGVGSTEIGVTDDFFELGGNSVFAMRLAGRLRAQSGAALGIREVFEAPTVEGIAARLDSRAAPAPPLVPRTRPDRPPLSAAQLRLWLLTRLEGNGWTYNMPLALRIRGPLDAPALRAALHDVLTRHESLRTVLPEHNGKPYQLVLGPEQTAVELRELPAGALHAAAAEPFDLAVETPVRAHLQRIAGEEHVLLLVVHHVAADGWSLAPLARDVLTAYRARTAGTAPQWDPLPVQYVDYALWQQELLTEELVTTRLRYWTERLVGAPAELDLPTDRLRPTVPSYRAGSVAFELDSATHAAVTRLARTHGSTVFMVVQAAVAVLCSRLGAGNDIPIATPIAGRHDPALDELIGVFTNTLVLRTDVSGNPSFGALLDRVRDADLGDFANDELPFERLVDELAPQRSAARPPIAQVMLAFGNTEPPSLQFPGGSARPEPLEFATARFDLAINLTEDDGLHGAIEYAADLFDEQTVHAFAERLHTVLRGVTEDPGTRVGALELLTPAEHAALSDWNDTGADVPALGIAGLFERQVTSSPGSTALSTPDGAVTFGELDARANGLAALLAERGAGPETFVAICLPRGAGLIAAMLAVAKAGAAYLPVDPEYPAERVAYLFADAQPVLALADAYTAERVPGGTTVLDVEQAAPAAAFAALRVATLDSAAYVIYTSGSTGRPKGVVVTGRGVAGLVQTQAYALELAPGARMLQFASPSFDAMFWEFAALLHGATLVLGPAERLVPGKPLAEFIDTFEVSHATLPPAALPAIEDELPGLRKLMVAGETCPPEVVNRWSPGRTIRNGYGPTETTVAAAISEPLEPGTEGRPPIGRPVRNARVHVLDQYLRPVPIGVTGELYVEGANLARGYFDRPALTASRFLAAPGGKRWYRTGDLVRRRADGQLDYLGRADRQVQLRGFRVELGEIEQVLAAQEGVRAATVALRDADPGRPRQLVGYVVGQCDPERLRAAVAAALPEHMVPAAVVPLLELPLTRNGKIDSAALPAPEFSTSTAAACGADEEAVVAAFCEVLGLDRVGVDERFFELGGDSIVAIQLVARVRAAGLVISPRDVFTHQDPRSLAAVARTGQQQGEPDGAGVGALPLTPIMRWLAGFDHVQGFHQSVLLRGPSDVDPERLAGALQRLIDRHDGLRLRIDSTWHAEITAPATVGAQLRVTTLGDRDVRTAVAAESRAEQQALALEGPMLRAVLIRPGLLLLVAHHAAVDAVSWRILLPDLLAALRGHELDPVYTSLRRWAKLLTTAAASPERVAELEGWREVLRGGDPLTAELGTAAGGTAAGGTADRGTAGELRRFEVTVPAEQAAGLLDTLPAAYHAKVSDLLLTALALALARWSGTGGGLLVELEGHGRMELEPGIDLSRTVGWFTATYPVRLDAGSVPWAEVTAGGAVLSHAIKRVKEQVRAMPDDGIGYGLLRYLNPACARELADAPTPQLGFNYLGRVAAPADAEWSIAEEADALTDGLDPAMAAPHGIQLDVLARDGALYATWSYAGGTYSEPAIGELAQLWRAALGGIAAHGAAPETGGHTPSDIALVEVDQEELEEFELFLGDHE